jgi:DNA-binding LytR/AlgR family response regulator
MKSENQILIGGYRKICPSSILMLKADTNYTITYLTDGSHFLSATTLGVLEERLRDFNFYRTHRSTLINLNYLSMLNMKNFDQVLPELQLSNNINIPIARRKLPDFMKKIQVMMLN